LEPAWDVQAMGREGKSCWLFVPLAGGPFVEKIQHLHKGTQRNFHKKGLIREGGMMGARSRTITGGLVSSFQLEPKKRKREGAFPIGPARLKAYRKRIAKKSRSGGRKGPLDS